jgi:acetyl-CoA carboxylase biotin carboxylase subunit
MIGKLIVHADTRTDAIARMDSAISEFRVGPIKTTLPLHRRLIASEPFVKHDFDIHWVERLLEEPEPVAAD